MAKTEVKTTPATESVKMSSDERLLQLKAARLKKKDEELKKMRGELKYMHEEQKMKDEELKIIMRS